MPKLTIDRLEVCSHRGCSNLATAQDRKCNNHTICKNLITKSRFIPNPNNLKNPFGIEMEFYVGNGSYTSRDSIYNICYDASSDGSLYNGVGVEVRVLEEANKVGREAGRILKSIHSTHTNKPYIDRTCGLHIHINMRDRYQNSCNDRYTQRLEIARKLAPYLIPLQDELYSIFPERARTGGYASSFNNARRLTEERYLWLAISPRYPTLECRLHPGSVNPDVVIAWSKCCVQLQKLLNDIIDGKNTVKTRAAKRGKFFTQFQKGTVARHYIEYRRTNINARLSEKDEHYSLPCL